MLERLVGHRKARYVGECAAAVTRSESHVVPSW